MLNLSDTTLDDNALAGSLRDAPQKAIILIEDVDAAFVGRGEVAADGNSGGSGRGGRSGISFSGLLNAIDGAASQEGRCDVRAALLTISCNLNIAKIT